MFKFCYVCGKKEEIEGLCKKCYLEKTKITGLPKKVEIKICPKCNQFFLKNRWQDFDINKFFKHMLKDNIKIKKVDLVEEKRADNFYEIFISNKKEKIKREQKHKIQVHLNRVCCFRCSRFASNYFESIIQLRGNYKDDVLKIVFDYFKNLKNEVPLHRVEKLKEGLDIYVADKKISKRIVNILKKRFNVKPKESHKDAGFYQGKKISKVVYSIRI